MEGWIKLYRKFSEWEWFNISEMVHLFIYLLLNANHIDSKWRGIEIKRGQILTGLNSLHDATGISMQTLRTCLRRLEDTQEINSKVTNKYRIITLCKYDDYQGEMLNSNKQANKQLTSNQQATNNKQEYKEYKEDNINIPFDDFWNLYNKKVGSKQNCQKKWIKLSNTTRQKIIDTLPTFLKSIRDIQFVPHPETYLNQERWNDEVILPAPEKTDINGNPRPSSQHTLVNGKWTVI